MSSYRAANELAQKPFIYRGNGGGGNRTRVESFADNAYLQGFYRRAGAASLFSGPQTSLYGIEDNSGAIKLGVARDPRIRLDTLQQATWRDLTLVFAIPATQKVERFIHKELIDSRIRGEWFKPSNRVQLIIYELLSVAEMCEETSEHYEFSDIEDTEAIFEIRNDPEFWDVANYNLAYRLSHDGREWYDDVPDGPRAREQESA